MHAVSYAFGREEEGTILGDIKTVLWESIFYNIYGQICRIPEIFPRFLKRIIHIPEEGHLGFCNLHA